MTTIESQSLENRLRAIERLVVAFRVEVNQKQGAIRSELSTQIRELRSELSEQIREGRSESASQPQKACSD